MKNTIKFAKEKSEGIENKILDKYATKSSDAIRRLPEKNDIKQYVRKDNNNIIIFHRYINKRCANKLNITKFRQKFIKHLNPAGWDPKIFYRIKISWKRYPKNHQIYKCTNQRNSYPGDKK